MDAKAAIKTIFSYDAYSGRRVKIVEFTCLKYCYNHLSYLTKESSIKVMEQLGRWISWQMEINDIPVQIRQNERGEAC